MAQIHQFVQLYYLSHAWQLFQNCYLPSPCSSMSFSNSNLGFFQHFYFSNRYIMEGKVGNFLCFFLMLSGISVFDSMVVLAVLVFTATLRLSSWRGEWGLLHCSTWSFHCGGFSLRSTGIQVHGLQESQHMGSVVALMGLQSAGSVVAGHELSCPAWACGIFLTRDGIAPLHWQADS